MLETPKPRGVPFHTNIAEGSGHHHIASAGFSTHIVENFQSHLYLVFNVLTGRYLFRQDGVVLSEAALL